VQPVQQYIISCGPIKRLASVDDEYTIVRMASKCRGVEGSECSGFKISSGANHDFVPVSQNPRAWMDVKFECQFLNKLLAFVICFICKLDIRDPCS
jgi:hypothetical protein